MPPIELVVFDIAGTTVMDRDLVLRAFRATARRYDCVASDAWFKAMNGVDKVQVFRELLTNNNAQADAEAMASDFSNEIERIIHAEGGEPTPGAIETLATLRDMGVKIALTTGFSRRIGELVVAAAGLRVDTIVGSDEVEHGRPAPDLVFEAMRRLGIDDVTRVIVVGDTPVDLGCGMNANAAAAVGVGCGTHTLEELRDHPHTQLLPDLHGFVEAMGIVEPVGR